MNKEELIKEFNEKVEQLKDELIAKLEEKKKFEVKLPDMYDTLYYIDDICSEVYITNFVSSARDKDRYLRGFYFNTEEEAKQRLKEQRLLFKIKKWAEIHNEGWEPDWSDDEKKWYVYYNHVEERLNVTWGYNSTNFAKLPYFKTREIAQECIDIFGDEIKEVLC
nr:MAG TPA: hypothetical protein [Caudoviricetes sp.]DAS55845.1 MAG TPA: hypothetical protein [Caudoviricetes sp.]